MLFRTVFICILLVIAIRVMGKRQLGELEISELVTTLLLSELATLPITNPEIPLLFAVIPIILIMSIEVFSSFLTSKFPRIKSLVTPRPAMLICHGKVQSEVMKNMRISLEELLMELRQNCITDIDEVEYAILEQNGKISIIPKSKNRQPDCGMLGISVKEVGIMHIIIAGGKVYTENLDFLGKDRKWLDSVLRKNKLTVESVYYLLCDDSGKVVFEEKKSKK